ncbi:zincin-like metallopeptidase domain-containing protein [Vampirovibrio sp.]|uniref:zincin-like metallopeptidase domain-containing protein n=1 Tax=Vampirovibrio sp. TaxID=2717857 RepID=UPI003593B5E7
MSDYAKTVSESIIRQLEQGTAPWLKPWQSGERFLPFNPTTGNAYKGINAVWLLSTTENKGYSDTRWLTYKQAGSLDAQVNKGEKGTMIQFWKWHDEIPKRDEEGRPVLDENGNPLKIRVRLQCPTVRSAIVFNAQQISGLPAMELKAGLTEWERHTEAEAILKDSQALIDHAPGNRAFYRPSSDKITLPLREQFPSADNYYATALHELGHWTGHESRLNRDLQHPFGSEAYAKEELRAEIASLMLGEKLSIGHDPGQHAAYIGSWIKVLQEDPREIFRASADAEKITQYLLGREMLKVQTQATQEEPKILIPVVKIQEESALRVTPERVYLEVPYAEKEAVKKLGAKWDRQEKSWYAPEGVALEPLKQWVQSPQVISKVIATDPQAEFALALQDAGLQLKGLPIMDGKLHRVPVEGDKQGQKNGGYVGFMDGHPAGYINNYKTGLETTWKSEQPVNRLSESDRIRLEQETMQRQLKRAQEREEIQVQTANLVAECWLNSSPVQNHPYLERKGVQAHGVRINTHGSVEIGQTQPDEPAQHWSGHGELLIPIVDIEGRFWGAQSIDAQGRKSFPRGGRIQGGHHVLGDIQEGQPILISEGYATAATVHEALGLPVVVAFNSGNLPTVAQAFREKYPANTLVITGDNDHTKPIEKNVGLLKAQEAAQKVGGHLLNPEFEKGSTGTDWNDFAQEKGKEAVRQQLQVGLALIKAQSKTFTQHQALSQQEAQPHLLTKKTQVLTR